MQRTFFYLLGATLLVAAAANAAERPATVIESTIAGPLTLTGAKQIVSQSFQDSGQHQFRAGRAEFDGNGNVLVEIVSLQGVAYGHVLVDGQTHRLAAAKGRNGATRGG